MTTINTPKSIGINNSGQIALLDAVPFRLTLNLQALMGRIGIEGVFAECIRVTASAFAQVEKGDLGLAFPLFLRDEIIAWMQSVPAALNGPGTTSPMPQESALDKEAAILAPVLSYDNDFCASRIKPNIELFNKRILTLACVKELELAQNAVQKSEDVIPSANQAILDLISCATNPQKLALMDPVWQPWF